MGGIMTDSTRYAAMTDAQRESAKAAGARWRARNPGAHRDRHLQRTYGVTLEEFEQKLAEQGGRCAICGTDDPGVGNGRNWHADHDHDTGKFRGVLCRRCNPGLGLLQDSEDLLIAAILYLRRTR